MRHTSGDSAELEVVETLFGLGSQKVKGLSDLLVGQKDGIGLANSVGLHQVATIINTILAKLN